MTATATGSAAADGQLVRRFAAALARLNPTGGRIGLAVSGGPDSMAMLLLTEAAIRGGFEVATVDHGLRAEAAGECSLVERACAERGIPCTILKVEVDAGNVQEQARKARYRALSTWAQRRGFRSIATAHHADDQAETLLMRLNRGSGVAGLAGVRETGRIEGLDTPIIRPLLKCRRAELARVVEAAGLLVAQDPSNHDDRFDRARLRKALDEARWLDPLALTESAAHLAEADEALDAFAELAWTLYVAREGNAIRFHPLVPRAIRLRVVSRIIRELGGRPRGSDAARLLDRLEVGGRGNLGGVLARVAGEHWLFRSEPPRRLVETPSASPSSRP